MPSVPGGVPVYSAEGTSRIGAVGASGEDPADDVACAVAGIEAAGLRILASKMVRLTETQAKAFYAVHKDRPFYGDLVKFMTEGPVVVQVLDILVMVTTALLGAAVVIAVVGIANTLSLSVVERLEEVPGAQARFSAGRARIAIGGVLEDLGEERGVHLATALSSVGIEAEAGVAAATQRARVLARPGMSEAMLAQLLSRAPRG